METQTKTRQPRIVRGRTELYIPHQNTEIAFAYPSVGLNTYTKAMKGVLEQKQRLPTGDEIASLVHSAYFSDSKDEPEFDNIRKLMRNKWLWVPNRNLWTKDGVYVVYDEKGVGRTEELDISKLEKILKGAEEIKGVRFSEDGKVRFAPKETYKGGEQTFEDFSNNGSVIANYGVEGAEKLAEVSKKFKNNPYVWVLETNQPEQRISPSALCGSVGVRVIAGGDYFGD